MDKKIEVFGKSMNTPQSIAGLSGLDAAPMGGIPSGVFAIFAVVILTVSLATYMPEDLDSSNGNLTESQSTYLENILSDRSRSSPTLSTYDTCGFLEMDLKEHLKEEMRVNLGTSSYYYGGWGMVDDMAMAEEVDMAMDDGGMDNSAVSTPSSSDKISSEPEQGVDYSGTNNQEQGIEEADFVKTDGSYIYIVNGGYSEYGKYPSGKVHILEIPEVGNVSYLSNISIEGSPNEMLLVGDKAVVYSNVYVYSYYEEEHPLADNLRTEFKREKVETVTAVSEGKPAEPVEEGTTSSEGKSDSRADNDDVESDEKEPEEDKEILEDDDYYYEYYYRTTSFTKITVLDLTNRSSPQVSRELYIEGDYQTARESDGTVRMVSYGWMEIYGLRTWLDFSDYRNYWDLDWDSPKREQMWMEKMNETIEYNDRIIDSTPLDNLIPRIYEKSGSNITTHKYSESGVGNCQNFASASDGAGQGVTSIMTLDLLEDNFSFNADHILSNWATVYASGDVMIMAESAWNSWWFWGDEESENTEMTNLHVFDISSPGQTDYIASGRVNGTIQDQFSLSEYNGNIRVCSTTGQWGRWWMDDPEPMVSHVFILGLNVEETEYEVIGHVGGIAEGEQIWSARFMGDKAYLVTFRNIDPLWTIDLSEPTNPMVIGELEVPGVSTYIHPVGDNHLLTIGIAGDEDGLEWGVTQISLFDVSDFSNPILASSLRLTPAPEDEYDWSYSYSEATYEHKAFQYWEADGLLAIPMSTQRYYSDYKEIDGKMYYSSGYEYLSKLILINAKPGEDLSIYNEVDHSSFYDSSYWWDSPDVRRSIFMGGGDYIYAISEKGVTAHNVDTMERTGLVELPSDNKPNYVDYYYDDVVDVETEPVEDNGEDREDSDDSSNSEEESTGSES
ncbi:MAG: beta-propeller domain-containing protein [Candidatus Poseidoniia archaeon]|nr:beta-propeller domain-containing protein [Candidatus Poseidoniia archaeon]